MTQTQSPLPTRIEPDKELPKVVEVKPDKVLFDFPNAIKQLILGKKISKEEWKSTKIYGFMKDGRLMLQEENKIGYWSITDGDLMGKDWYVL